MVVASAAEAITKIEPCRMTSLSEAAKGAKGDRSDVRSELALPAVGRFHCQLE